MLDLYEGVLAEFAERATADFAFFNYRGMSLRKSRAKGPRIKRARVRAPKKRQARCVVCGLTRQQKRWLKRPTCMALPHSTLHRTGQ